MTQVSEFSLRPSAPFLACDSDHSFFPVLFPHL